MREHRQKPGKAGPSRPGFLFDDPGGETLAVFNVNETLLDLGALDELLFELSGSATARREWLEPLISQSRPSRPIAPRTG